LAFLTVEKRGSNGVLYYYLCSYDPVRRNVHKRYLGPVSSSKARKDADFFKWLNTLNKEKVKKLRDESAALERLRPSFHTSLERVLELREYVRQS